MSIMVKGVKFKWSFQKFIVNIFIVSILFCGSILYLTNVAKATSENKVSFLTVRRGQTLWSIARQIAPEQDPRDVIARIKKDNQLQDSHLVTGQTLKVAEWD